MKRRQVYLVPGFFGFSRLGGRNYFQGVGKVLRAALEQHGVEAEVVDCRTKPTASIRHRADRLVDEVHKHGGLEAEEIHFIGHSTGGLDARLLASPTVRLRPEAVEIERAIVSRTRSVITVATPHYGTPLASFFTTILGRQILQALTALATSRSGRVGLLAAAQLVGLVASADELLGSDGTFLDSVAQEVTSRAVEGGEDVWEYLHEVASDQGAMVQLMPEATHLFNAAVSDKAGVRYSSLVAIAPPPPSQYGVGTLLSPVQAALASVFTLLYTITSREHRHYPYPFSGADDLDRYREVIPFPLDSHGNDGIVPCLSQIYGEVIDVLIADHLDVVGQFVRDDIPHGDWLPSGSQFDWARFEKAWEGVAQQIVMASG